MATRGQRFPEIIRPARHVPHKLNDRASTFAPKYAARRWQRSLQDISHLAVSLAQAQPQKDARARSWNSQPRYSQPRCSPATAQSSLYTQFQRHDWCACNCAHGPLHPSCSALLAVLAGRREGRLVGTRVQPRVQVCSAHSHHARIHRRVQRVPKAWQGVRQRSVLLQ